MFYVIPADSTRGIMLKFCQEVNIDEFSRALLM